MIHNHFTSLFTMIYNHWLNIAHHDLQPLAKHPTPSSTTTGSA
jgi:hypothetical protein